MADYANVRVVSGRAAKILALIPKEYAESETSERSADENELHESSATSSNASSPAPSLASSLERLNISTSSEYEQAIPNHHPELHSIQEMDVPLTPIMQEVIDEENYANVPSISSIPSLPTPNTSRKTRSRRPQVVSKRRKVVKKFSLNYTWRRAFFQHRAEIETTNENDEYVDIGLNETVLDYFMKFFSEDIFLDIVSETNMYSVQKSGKSIDLSVDEFRDFLAIKIMMGIVVMPSYLDYWSKQFRYAPIADLMSLKRYQQIRRYLHFADINFENSDRYYKVRPVVEKIKKNCLAEETERSFSIDEQMIPYKGTKAGKRRQYMKDKPNKWGFKNYVRAGPSGMIYDFILYGGEDTFRFHKFADDEATLGFGAQIVLALCQSIKRRPSTVCFDNFFSSPELVYILREKYGIFSLGTIRRNRLRGADEKLVTEKLLKKKPRGSFSQVVCNSNKLAVLRWNDNKSVTFISSYVDSEPVQKIKRYCKIAKAKVDVDCPNMVKVYNKTMGGVDLSDMLISLYRIPFKSRRWYLSIFSQLIDICINNGWLLYRKHCDLKKVQAKPLKMFRHELFAALTKSNRAVNRNKSEECSVKRPLTARPVDSVRYDNVGHFMSTKTEGRCMYCNKKTVVYCMKCNVRLCFVTGKKPRNCQLNFHLK
ncbi:piggyBac transposable element-derived protein 2-like [Cydia amplana]|uniref:piggyBac transposable element-derived protein 2-like n=1 Tax=Cydia amplana TaxID=1869771 RepID=UPI002FE59BE6